MVGRSRAPKFHIGTPLDSLMWPSPDNNMVAHCRATLDQPGLMWWHSKRAGGLRYNTQKTNTIQNLLNGTLFPYFGSLHSPWNYFRMPYHLPHVESTSSTARESVFSTSESTVSATTNGSNSSVKIVYRRVF